MAKTKNPRRSHSRRYSVGKPVPLFETPKEQAAFEARMSRAMRPVLDRHNEIQRRSWEIASRIRIGASV